MLLSGRFFYFTNLHIGREQSICMGSTEQATKAEGFPGEYLAPWWAWVLPILDSWHHQAIHDCAIWLQGAPVEQIGCINMSKFKNLRSGLLIWSTCEFGQFLLTVLGLPTELFQQWQILLGLVRRCWKANQFTELQCLAVLYIVHWKILLLFTFKLKIMEIDNELEEDQVLFRERCCLGFQS